jgi:RHS repeat-associated protein
MRSTLLAGVGCLVLLLEAIGPLPGAWGNPLAEDGRGQALDEEVSGLDALERPSPTLAATERADLCDGVAASTFEDVVGNVHRANIDCLYALGVTVGVSATRYAPRGNVTRAQMASLIANGLTRTETEISLPSDPPPVFTDVSGVHANNIHALAELGIVQGRTPTSFAPNAPITRAQISTIIAGVHATATGESTTPTSDWFNDIAGNVHAHNIRIIRELGIAQGVTADEYRPGANVRRDQMATFLTNLLAHIAQPDPDPDPDPEFEPSPIDATVATTIYDSTRFLYTGDDPVQVGVDADVIEPRRAAVIRGRVLDNAGEPLRGATIGILEQPEYGHTFTRADGRFDLAVNGGGTLTIDYRHPDRLPAQRQVKVPWQGYANAADVALVRVDDRATTVDLSASEPQVHQASTVEDDDGERTATVLVPGEVTEATVTLPDGSNETLDGVTVRATEYTVGESGPEAMPADLPPNVGYTYAVELSVDEAEELGATRVDFDEPVISYVDDFVGFDTGQDVPAASYDRERGRWIPADDGRVIEILATDGLAEIDIDGDGEPNTVDELAALGISEGEHAELASLYQPGAVLWRTPVSNFSAWDYNWPIACEVDDEGLPLCLPPALGDLLDDPATADICYETGSLIECQTQVLRDRLSLVGTDQDLHYRSDRTPARARTLDIPLSDAELPDTVKAIRLQVDVAGQRFEERFPAETNLSHTFVWDGLDAYGRPVQGSTRARVRVGYVYRAVYGTAAATARSFGQFPRGVTASVARMEMDLWQEWDVHLAGWNARGIGIGGWTLTDHHAYDPPGRKLHLGDGTQVEGVVADPITALAGNGRACVTAGADPACGDGGPAEEARLQAPGTRNGLAVGADGAVYVTSNHRVRRIDPETGFIHAYAGQPRGGTPPGEGVPAREASLLSLSGLAVGPDDSLYLMARNRVWRVDDQGLLRLVAGTGEQCRTVHDPWPECGDDGPATEASFYNAQGIAVGSDGTVYIANRGHSSVRTDDRVRAVAPDGTITTVVGGGSQNSDQPGVRGLDVRLNNVSAVAVSPDGLLHIAEGAGANRVIRLENDGTITHVAGSGGASPPYGGGGVAATDTNIRSPGSLTFSSDGNLFVGFWRAAYRVLMIDGEGNVRTVAGDGTICQAEFTLPCGDQGPATAAQLYFPGRALAVTPAGDLIFTDHHRLRAISPSLPAFGSPEAAVQIPAQDGSEVYEFDGAGRHVRTRHPLTGATLRAFDYDEQGLLAAVTDSAENRTTIERGSDGTVTAIVGPFGQRTELEVDDAGWLRTATDPSGHERRYRYDDGGLLTSRTDPRGNHSAYEYDDVGRVVTATDASSATQTLTRAELPDGFIVTHRSAEGRATTYRTQRLAEERTTRQVISFPDDTETVGTYGTDGRRTISRPDGSTLTVLDGPDPRFGMLLPQLHELSYSTPGGLELQVTSERTVELEVQNDPLSLTAWQEATTINGRTYLTDYDGTRRQLNESTPEGREALTTLDRHGRVERYEAGGIAPIELKYNEKGLLERHVRGEPDEQRVTSLSYNERGLIEAITDPLGQTTFLSYDSASRPTTITRPDGETIGLEFDANANLATLTPPGKPEHRFGYTPSNLPSEYLPPLVDGNSAATAYTYDADRNPIRIDLPSGRAVELHHDNAGRLAGLTLERGEIAVLYDDRGRLAKIASPHANLSHTFDGPMATETSWTGTVAGTVLRSFDNDLRLAALTIDGSEPLLFTFDSDSLLTGAGPLNLLRDPQHGLVVTTEAGLVSDSTDHDIFGDEHTYTARYGGGVLFGASYQRDDLGRITQLEEEVEGEASRTDFDYDTAGRLARFERDGRVIASYEYDGNGNRIRETTATDDVLASYDEQDRLRTYGDISYTYTEEGQLSTKSEGGETVRYDFDELGNLLSVAKPDGMRIDYLIDGQNRRVGKKVSGELEYGLVYEDGYRVAAQIYEDGSRVQRFVYGTSPHSPDMMLTEGASYRLVKDHRGSIRLVVDIETGEVAQRIDYDPFGRVIEDTNPDFQPFGFAGGLYDTTTGLVRFGARDYDPEVGRWVSKDPIGFAGGQSNLYSYVGQDPINWVDPSGLTAEEAGPVAHEQDMATWLRIRNALIVYLVTRDMGVRPLSAIYGGGGAGIGAAVKASMGLAAVGLLSYWLGGILVAAFPRLGTGIGDWLCDLVACDDPCSSGPVVEGGREFFGRFGRGFLMTDLLFP